MCVGGEGKFYLFLYFFFFIMLGGGDSARYFQHMKVMVRGWLRKFVGYNLIFINTSRVEIYLKITQNFCSRCGNLYNVSI